MELMAADSVKLKKLSNIGILNVERSKEFGTCLSHLSRFFSNLKWKLFLFKYSILLSGLEADKQHRLKQHCNKGYHKMGRCSEEVHFKNKSWKVEYLKCSVCGWLFFSTARDKELFLKLNSRHRNIAIDGIMDMWGVKFGEAKKNLNTLHGEGVENEKI